MKTSLHNRGLPIQKGASFAFVALLLSTSSVSAQEEPAPSRLGSVQFGGGGFSHGQQLFVRGDLDALAPGSELLSRDLSGHVFRIDRSQDGESVVDLSIGLFPFAKGRQGAELRLGVLYGNGPSFGAEFSRNVHTPYDTLTSSVTGEQFFLDSVNRSDYRIGYTAERFGLNGSLVWRRPGRWSLYGGAGIMGGLLVNARTVVSHVVEVSVDGTSDYTLGGEDQAFDEDRQEELESFRNGAGWWFGAYVPLGLDFRVATVSTFWNRIHLCYELRPQVVLQSIPELREATRFGLQALFLVRMDL